MVGYGGWGSGGVWGSHGYGLGFPWGGLERYYGGFGGYVGVILGVLVGWSLVMGDLGVPLLSMGHLGVFVGVCLWLWGLLSV